MNKKTIAKSIIGSLIAIVVLLTRNTDIIFVGAGVLFFIICIAYAEWCERL